MAPLSILYVEDNADLRDTVGELLEDGGHVVTGCPDGETALELCRLQPFDVIITDIGLPGIPGTELTRRVLAERPLQWIVWCSGYDYNDRLSSFGVNVRALPKTFEFEMLECLLAEISAAIQLAPGT